MRFLKPFGVAGVFALPTEPFVGLAEGHAKTSPTWEQCADPWVIDGDSIRCRNLGEIRLLGIDAPDYRDSPPCVGHYGNHICDDAAAKAAKQALIRLKLQMPYVQWQALPITRDRYGRLVAEVRAGSIDLSCYQLANVAARYIPQYDNDGRIARTCRH